MRTPILICTLLLAWITNSAPARDNHGTVLDIADRNQIFIDERFLLEKQNVNIVVCPPVSRYNAPQMKMKTCPKQRRLYRLIMINLYFI